MNRRDHRVESGYRFPATPDGLRQWAQQIRDEANRKAASLEAMAQQIEQEADPLWPQRSTG